MEEDDLVDVVDMNEYYKCLRKLKEKSVNLMFDFGKTGSQLNLRNYQTELAESGMRGENVLICAPTGAGKTLVAVKIVEDHLEKYPTAKVAFLVHKLLLVEQQYKLFADSLGHRILSFSGNSKTQNTPLLWSLASADVFILTADILKNALEVDNENRLESINVFSLILFDECHNCDKKHSYNWIMSHYFKEKRAGNKVPQIVGLTASTGTNRAKSDKEALKQLFTLCANLDTSKISTVNYYKTELDEFHNTPDEEIVTPPPKSADPFDESLQLEMEHCESVMKELNEKEYFPQDAETQALLRFPKDKLAQKYSNVIGNLETKLYDVTCDFKEGKQSVIIIAKYLKVFYEALMVNHLFQSDDAIKLIRKDLGLSKDKHVLSSIENTLIAKTNEMINKFESRQPLKNPCLECLKEKIKSQFASDPGSRIIVFVRERIYTQILKNIFSSAFPLFKSEIMLSDLNKTEVQDILARFKRNDIKILFSTSIAEEGVDISTCNMVIKYGHVTNEISRMQSRGRARAAVSKYIVIVPPNLLWQCNKENINKYRESMIYRAIEEFQRMPEDKIREQIRECQTVRDLTVNVENLKQIRISDSSITDDGSIWQIRCKKCGQAICTSNDIRLAEKVHHCVVNEECFKNMKLMESDNKNNCKILCVKCETHIANRQNYKSVLLPNLKIDSVSMARDGESITCKKWTAIPFQVKECMASELKMISRGHCLSK